MGESVEKLTQWLRDANEVQELGLKLDVVDDAHIFCEDLECEDIECEHEHEGLQEYVKQHKDRVNEIIECWLREYDSINDTKYAPTGYARARWAENC